MAERVLVRRRRCSAPPSRMIHECPPASSSMLQWTRLSSYFRNTIVLMARKIRGEEVSEVQVDAWVAEAEEGYDVEELQKRIIGRPARGGEASRVVPVRLTDAELDAVMKRADK